MGNEPALKLKILTELDKSGMQKEIDQLKKSFDTGIVNQLQSEIKVLKKAIGQGTDESQLKPLIEMKKQAQQQLYDVTGGEYGRATKTPVGEETTQKETSGLLQGIQQGIGPILGLLTKISIGAALGAAVLDVLKPALNIFNQIFKLIGEFFRPMMYIALSLLMPILNLLKPILMVFNSIFAPFKTAIMKLNASASLDIAKGMKENDAGLLASGMTKSLLAAGLGLEGFKEAMLAVGLQLLKLSMNASSQLLTLIIKTVSNGFAMLIGIFSQQTANKYMGIMGTIAGGIEATYSNIYQLLDNAVGAINDTAISLYIDSAKELGVDIGNDLSSAISGISLGDAVLTFINNEKEIFEEVASTIGGILTGEFDDTFKNLDLSSSFDTFKQMIVDNTKSVMEDAQLQLEADAKAKKDAQLALDSNIKSDLSKTDKVSFYDFIPPQSMNPSKKDFDLNNYNPFKSQMDMIKKGADESYNDIETSTTTYMGTDGSVPKTYKNGMSDLTLKTNAFSSAVEKTSKLLDNAVGNMYKYAQLYFSALSKIESLNRINSTRGKF